MRKHVTPADQAAAIPDPERGRDLPPEGAPVAWSAYWAGRAARGEITVTEMTDEAEAPEEPDPEKPIDRPSVAPPRGRRSA